MPAVELLWKDLCLLQSLTCPEATVPGIFGSAVQKAARRGLCFSPVALECSEPCQGCWGRQPRRRGHCAHCPCGVEAAGRGRARPAARWRTGMHGAALRAQTAREQSSGVQLLPRNDGLNSKERARAREEAAGSASQRRGRGDPPRLQVPVCSTARAVV